MEGRNDFDSYFQRTVFGANAAFLLFDLTRPATLDNLSEWTSIVRQKAGLIPIILVGSKLDLVTKNRKILKEHGIQIAKKNKCHDYIEVSAKENINVNSAFKALTETSIHNLR